MRSLVGFLVDGNKNILVQVQEHWWPRGLAGGWLPQELPRKALGPEAVTPGDPCEQGGWNPVPRASQLPRRCGRESAPGSWFLTLCPSHLPDASVQVAAEQTPGRWTGLGAGRCRS